MNVQKCMHRAWTCLLCRDSMFQKRLLQRLAIRCQVPDIWQSSITEKYLKKCIQDVGLRYFAHVPDSILKLGNRVWKPFLETIGTN